MAKQAKSVYPPMLGRMCVNNPKLKETLWKIDGGEGGIVHDAILFTDGKLLFFCLILMFTQCGFILLQLSF